MITEIARAIEHRNNSLHIYSRLYSIMPRTYAMIIAKSWQRTRIYHGMNCFLKYLATERNRSGFLKYLATEKNRNEPYQTTNAV